MTWKLGQKINATLDFRLDYKAYTCIQKCLRLLEGQIYRYYNIVIPNYYRVLTQEDVQLSAGTVFGDCRVAQQIFLWSNGIGFKDMHLKLSTTTKNNEIT